MNKDDLLARQQSLPTIESGHDGRILGPKGGYGSSRRENRATMAGFLARKEATEVPGERIGPRWPDSWPDKNP